MGVGVRPYPAGHKKRQPCSDKAGEFSVAAQNLFVNLIVDFGAGRNLFVNFAVNFTEQIPQPGTVKDWHFEFGRDGFLDANVREPAFNLFVVQL